MYESLLASFPKTEGVYRLTFALRTSLRAVRESDQYRVSGRAVREYGSSELLCRKE